jgi:hypothetical protein
VVALTEQIDKTISSVGDVVSDGTDPSRARDAVSGLRDTATETYNKYKGQLPAKARSQVDAALRALGG